MNRSHTSGEPCEGLPFFPDGIEPSDSLAALVENFRDERRALCAIVLEAVAEAIVERSEGAVTRNALLWRRDETTGRWRMLALAVTKAALGLAGSLREVAEIWDLPLDVAEEMLAEHQRRMGHPQAYFEHKADADALAIRVMRATGALHDG